MEAKGGEKQVEVSGKEAGVGDLELLGVVIDCGVRLGDHHRGNVLRVRATSPRIRACAWKVSMKVRISEEGEKGVKKCMFMAPPPPSTGWWF